MSKVNQETNKQVNRRDFISKTTLLEAPEVSPIGLGCMSKKF